MAENKEFNYAEAMAEVEQILGEMSTERISIFQRNAPGFFIIANKYSVLGIVVPFSHFETDCRVTHDSTRWRRALRSCSRRMRRNEVAD